VEQPGRCDAGVASRSHSTRPSAATIAAIANQLTSGSIVPHINWYSTFRSGPWPTRLG